jgi:hypothetical protein
MPGRPDLVHRYLTAIRIYSSAAVLDRYKSCRSLFDTYTRCAKKKRKLFSRHMYHGNFHLNETRNINFQNQQRDQVRDIICSQNNVIYYVFNTRKKDRRPVIYVKFQTC